MVYIDFLLCGGQITQKKILESWNNFFLGLKQKVWQNEIPLARTHPLRERLENAHFWEIYLGPRYSHSGRAFKRVRSRFLILKTYSFERKFCIFSLESNFSSHLHYFYLLKTNHQEKVEKQSAQSLTTNLVSPFWVFYKSMAKLHCKI